nr:MAG TPA: hypothetical protein [Caudoviricetes sp.]
MYSYSCFFFHYFLLVAISFVITAFLCVVSLSHKLLLEPMYRQILPHHIPYTPCVPFNYLKSPPISSNRWASSILKSFIRNYSPLVAKY